MGKTVPSYRMALQWEIDAWRGFREGLVGDVEREAFDRLMDSCRNQATAAGNACRCEVFEAMVMSILLSLMKQISKLEEKMNILFALRGGLKVAAQE